MGVPDQCQQLVRATVGVFGQLDIDFDNAGIGRELNLSADYSVEGWQHIININLNGVFYCLKYELEAMQKQPGTGSIVNMASILGQVGTARPPGYVAAKHGIVGLTKAAAIENAARGIRINAVGPAYIDTPLLSVLPDEAKKMLAGLHPIGRLERAEEVAELVVWLSSDKASFVLSFRRGILGSVKKRSQSLKSNGN